MTTPPDFKFSQLQQLAVPSMSDIAAFVHTSDITTPPAGPAGSNQRTTLGKLLGPVVWPSGDPTGVKDAAAVMNATASIPASGGVIRLMPGVWYIQCGVVNINASGVYIDAAGCLVNAVGAGDMIRMFDSSSANGRLSLGGGILGMPVIDGTGTTGAASAFHAGDILQLACFVRVKNFTQAGSYGVHLDNNYIWTEQVYGRIYAKSCATLVAFDNSADTSGSSTGSFMRMDLDVFLEDNGLGDGVVFLNGAFLADGRLGIWGNFATGAASHAVLRLTGSNSGGSSRMQNAGLDIGVELGDTTNTVPQTIAFGAAGNSIIGCRGALDFALGHPFAASNNNGQFGFSGPVHGDTALQKAQSTFGYTSVFGGFPAGWTGKVAWRKLDDGDLVFLKWALTIASGSAMVSGTTVATIAAPGFFPSDNTDIPGTLSGGETGPAPGHLTSGGIFKYQGPAFTPSAATFWYGQGVFSNSI